MQRSNRSGAAVVRHGTFVERAERHREAGTQRTGPVPLSSDTAHSLSVATREGVKTTEFCAAVVRHGTFVERAT